MMFFLKAVLGLDASGYAIGLKRAEGLGRQFSNTIKNEFAKAFGVTSLILYTKKVLDLADHITDLSDRLGVSTDALQEWGYAARKNGASLDDVARFFEALASSRDKAVEGSKEMREAFAAFGLSVNDLKSDRIEDLGKKIGAVVRNGDIQKLSASLKQIGGKGATSLVAPMKAGLDEMAAAARKAGQVLSDETLFALKQIKTEMIGLADAATGPVADAIIFLSQQFENIFDLIKVAVAFGKTFGKGLINNQGPVNPGVVGGVAGGGMAGTQAGAAAGQAQQNAFIGPPVPVKTLTEIFEEAMESVFREIGEREARQTAKAQALADRRALTAAGQGGSTAEEKLKADKQDVNELQKIGAFVAGPKPELVELKAIREKTKETAQNTAAIKQAVSGGEQVSY